MTRPSLSPLTFHEFERPRLQPIRILRQNLAGLLRGSVRLVSRAFVGAFNVDLCSERSRKTLPASATPA